MKSIKLHKQWIIKASVEDVARIMTDFENMPKNFPKVAESVNILKKDGNNLEMEATVKSFGKNFKVKMKTEILPGKGFISDNDSYEFGTSGHEELLLSPVSEGTLIDYTYEVTIHKPWLRFVATPLIKWYSMKAWEKAVIDELKKILEVDRKQQNIDTYNRSAKSLTIKFNNLNGYPNEIKNVISMINKDNPFVLEIGCGNGRDAEEIVKYTKNYLGIDISEELIKIARERNPGIKFEIKDIENYDIENNIDIIFAFASLLHVPIKSLKSILDLAYSRLNNNGIIFATLKYNDYYTESTKTDEFGTRTYYLYSKESIEKVANNFKVLKYETYDLNGQTWITVLLQKVI